MTGKNVDTRSAYSGSSLQLTLENPDLDSVKREYLNQLGSVLDGKTDVIGFLYVINGEINCAEVYNNKTLFRALWPKLLDAAVTEAVTDCDSDRKFQPVHTEELKSFFETAVSGAVSERRVWKSTAVKTYNTPTTVLFETLDLDSGGGWIHKSFINKGIDRVTVPLDNSRQEGQPQRFSR